MSGFLAHIVCSSCGAVATCVLYDGDAVKVKSHHCVEPALDDPSGPRQIAEVPGGTKAFVLDFTPDRPPF